MGGSSRSKSNQTQEGDVVFNNVDYGGQGSGAGALKNFNVGRENKLVDNVFNITDGGATRNALAASVAMANSSNNAVVKGTQYALGSNEAVSKAAIESANKSASEAIKASTELGKRTLDYAGDTNRIVTDFSDRSNERAYDLSRHTLSTYEDLVARTGQQVTDAQVTSQQATGKALDYVFQSSKSATERQSENLIKYATYGGIAIVSAVALTAMARGARA